MKAIILDNDKQPRWQTVDDLITDARAIGPHEIGIKVHATAVNRADLVQRAGLYPPPPGASDILGLECAGQVTAIGQDVTQWKVGDRVCALLSGGGYAEQVVCPANHALPIPAGLSYEQAAALPEVFATAWLNLFMLAKLQPGQKAMVHAGASGVGCAAIQLCKAFNNPIFVTVGTAEKLIFCRNLGAEEGHIRSAGDFAPAVKAWSDNKGVSAILDPVGGNYLEQNIKCLHSDGNLVIIGLMGGLSSTLDLGRLLMKRLNVMGSTLRSRDNASKADIIAQLNDRVWPLFDSGQLKPTIHSTFRIEEAADALALVASNQTIGKVVLNIQ